MVDIVGQVAGQNPSQGAPSGVVLPAPVAGSAAPTTPSQDAPPEGDPSVTVQNGQVQSTGSEPIAEPAAQPKVDEVPHTTGDDGAVVYDETGDPGLDLALSFIGGLGIAGDDPVMVAAANGDFSLLEAKLSAMGNEAKGWEKHVALGKQAFERQLNAFKKEQSKSLSICHQIAGGDKQWNEIVKWAGTVASVEEKAALNAMFDAGPIQARMAAQSLVSAYRDAKGTTIAPANPAPAASGAAPAVQKTLTAADYAREVDSLYRKMGNAMDMSQEYADLRARYFGGRR